MLEAAGPPRGDCRVAGSRPAGPRGLVERLRAVHLEMVDAVLGGDGLARVAALAADAAGARGDRRPAAGRRRGRAGGDLGFGVAAPLRRRSVGDRPAPVPAGGGRRGADRLRRRRRRRRPAARRSGGGRRQAGEFLHLAAVASLTEVAVEEAKEEVEQNLRGSFLEDLRSRPDLEPREIVRRAGRLGCDLSRGAVVLCAELTTDRPRHVVATIADEHPGALAQHMDGRVYALLPVTAGDDAPRAHLERPAGSPRACSATGPSACRVLRRPGRARPRDPGGRARARRPAPSDAPIAEDIGTGTYRLLFRVLASHPEEVRSFYEDTVAPIVRYDDQYRTDLVGTLEAYLEQNCNMNATAAAIYAHRHTVAYRLERVKELTGLDPMLSEDRERLGPRPQGLPDHRAAAAEVVRFAVAPQPSERLEHASTSARDDHHGQAAKPATRVSHAARARC